MGPQRCRLSRRESASTLCLEVMLDNWSLGMSSPCPVLCNACFQTTLDVRRLVMLTLVSRQDTLVEMSTGDPPLRLCTLDDRTHWWIRPTWYDLKWLNHTKFDREMIAGTPEKIDTQRACQGRCTRSGESTTPRLQKMAHETTTSKPTQILPFL